MALRVTTTGSDVFLYDLGIILAHPTTNRDLALEFTDLELKLSLDLTDAIQNGDLLVDDGTHSIAADDYDPDEVLLQSLGIRGDTKYISNDELGSSGTTVIRAATFPIAVNSTAASTRNVYVPGGRWITWDLEVGDIVIIAGNAAAGTYTVESVTDQQNFIVAESILNSTGGTLTIYHQVAAKRIGVDPTNLTFSNETNLQAVLEDIAATSGINANTHRTLDQLVHDIAEDSWETFTYSGIFVTSNTIWTDPTETIKIRKYDYTYGVGNRVSRIDIYQYDALGAEVEHVYELYTYSGINVQTIDREYV